MKRFLLALSVLLLPAAALADAPPNPAAPLADPAGFVASLVQAIAGHQWILAAGLGLAAATVGLMALGKRSPWFQSRGHHMLLVWAIDSLAILSAILAAPGVKIPDVAAGVGMVLTAIASGAVMSGVAAAVAHYVMPTGAWSGDDSPAAKPEVRS